MIIQNSLKEKAINVSGLFVLEYDCLKGPALKIWKPKAFKPYVNNYFSSIQAREEFIKKEIYKFNNYKAIIAERKTNRVGTKEQIDTAVKVGDIFHDSWGYEQTNADFYQVIDKKGAFIIVREIKQNVVETGFMSGRSMPTKDVFVDNVAPIRKKLQFNSGKPYITIRSYGWCGLWDGEPCSVSWYA